ncbi:hypothetical protein TNCV_1565981 [Trichonephila clavipes]|nr:hypothetical protein TNCV_1565981 [Trichonephila clavipes]
MVARSVVRLCFRKESFSVVAVDIRQRGRVVAEWYRYWIVAGFVMSSSPIPLKTRRVGAAMHDKSVESWKRPPVGVVVREGWCQLRCRSRHLTMVQNYVGPSQSPRVAEQCDVNIHSPTL